MRIVKPSFEILRGLDQDTLRRIESYGRTCYKSECRMAEGTDVTFAKALIDRQHESVIEHESVTVRIVCDRGVSHELVRHRIASYSQESTRYCNYTKDGFGNEITVIQPPDLDYYQMLAWRMAMEDAEKSYKSLIDLGATPQIARGVLPNSLKTEVVATMNLRSWRHFFKMRTPKSAHPQMREIAIPMLQEFQRRIPIIFDGIEV